MSEDCKSPVLQDKCNIEIFLSPVVQLFLARNIRETVNALCKVSILEEIIIQHLSFDLPSWSVIMPCIKIDKPPVNYIFSSIM